MYKYKEPLSDENRKTLESFSEKDFSNYSEADIREEVIAPLVKMLGYEKNTDYEVEREESFQKDKIFLKAGSKEKLQLDYLCNIRKNNFWLIEAKNGEKKDISEEELQQAYLYSLHPKVNCRYFAVTNGWFFNLYDRNKYLIDDNADIFNPILSINHAEYNTKFDLLYSKIGSSNVLFNVKEECLLNEIEKTLSSEVYLNRLSYFETKVKNVIQKSEREVYRNIGKIMNRNEGSYESFLKTLQLRDLINTVFGQRNTNGNIDIGCQIIKEKLMELKNCYSDDRSPYDSFIRELLPINNPYCMEIFDPTYIYSVIALLISFNFDEDYSSHWCNYNGKKMYLPELLEEYLFDLYNFFPKKPLTRLNIRLFPLIYRESKMIVYGLPPVNALARFRMESKEYRLTEEELGLAFYSKGHELIRLAENITFQRMKTILSTMLNKNEILKTKVKQDIMKIESSLDALAQQINYENMIKELPKDEKDGMLAIDGDHNNPWRLIFSATSVVLPTNYVHSDRCREQIDKINRIGFNYYINTELDEEALTEHNRVLEILKYDFDVKESIL